MFPPARDNDLDHGQPAPPQNSINALARFNLQPVRLVRLAFWSPGSVCAPRGPRRPRLAPPMSAPSSHGSACSTIWLVAPCAAVVRPKSDYYTLQNWCWGNLQSAPPRDGAFCKDLFRGRGLNCEEDAHETLASTAGSGFDDEDEMRVRIASEFIENFSANNSRPSREWLPTGSRPPERQRVSPRGEKVMLKVVGLAWHNFSRFLEERQDTL